jgi:hypothetical protein
MENTHPLQFFIANGVSIIMHCKEKNAENWKQIFPEKEYRGLSPNFQIHVSVSELYIPTMELPFLLEEICGVDWTDPGNI